MLLAGAAFSGRLMGHVAALGGDFTRDEREAFVHVWRYAGVLFGIPEEILFHDEASAVRTFEIGRMCEPPTDHDGIIMANSVVNIGAVPGDVCFRNPVSEEVADPCRSGGGGWWFP